ncbi:HAD family hydrolase [Novosphingobium sp.]|uniref:sulfotransferase-like domain-containing protein n=1 Tax=Novosphingobium sp. TaxID=1874826 RepID=UPI0025FC88CC|nr:HAD family hydrolase [Novosphingobium sp.]
MTVRIAMWSGPRNISTAMMRAFENRTDTCVSDEPFYAAFLAESGADHPMREAVLQSQPIDWRAVAGAMTGPPPEPAAVWYQKHMCHHMLDGFGLDWTAELTNVFLIRDPAAVIGSYVVKREDVTLADLGFAQQQRQFDMVADRIGRAPPVIASEDVLANPRVMLAALCAAVGIAFDAPILDAMLAWPAGPRASDGVWAPAWYDAVHRSTGWAPLRPPARKEALPAAHQRIVEQAMPFYESLARHRLVAD